MLAFAETNCSDAECNDKRHERPCGFLQKVSRLRRTHNLVAARETGCQATALTILNQHQKRQQDSGDND